ncbi:MAG: hypothetical protein C4527_20410 [Candidatus Omnitrophota bacterium]|nr:MAG: hypothetical protein C4527_20410 [Candidatus Omnitrophota bacterium]
MAGGYRCSLPKMDRLVDRCKELEGVLGAGLTGAGLGGSILVFVRSDASTRVLTALREMIARGVEPEPTMELCRPCAGAAFLY